VNVTHECALPMSEATNNQDWREAIKAEITACVAADQPFDDLLAKLSAPALVEAPKPSKGSKQRLNNRAAPARSLTAARTSF
jgi:hypothetical protein